MQCRKQLQTGEELRTGSLEKPGQKVMLRERARDVCAVDIGNQGEVDFLITKTFRGLGIKILVFIFFVACMQTYISDTSLYRHESRPAGPHGKRSEVNLRNMPLIKTA